MAAANTSFTHTSRLAISCSSPRPFSVGEGGLLLDLNGEDHAGRGRRSVLHGGCKDPDGYCSLRLGPQQVRAGEWFGLDQVSFFVDQRIERHDVIHLGALGPERHSRGSLRHTACRSIVLVSASLSVR